MDNVLTTRSCLWLYLDKFFFHFITSPMMLLIARLAHPWGQVRNYLKQFGGGAGPSTVLCIPWASYSFQFLIWKWKRQPGGKRNVERSAELGSLENGMTSGWHILRLRGQFSMTTQASRGLGSGLLNRHVNNNSVNVIYCTSCSSDCPLSLYQFPFLLLKTQIMKLICIVSTPPPLSAAVWKRNK